MLKLVKVPEKEQAQCNCAAVIEEHNDCTGEVLYAWRIKKIDEVFDTVHADEFVLVPQKKKRRIYLLCETSRDFPHMMETHEICEVQAQARYEQAYGKRVSKVSEMESGNTLFMPGKWGCQEFITVLDV